MYHTLISNTVLTLSIIFLFSCSKAMQQQNHTKVLKEGIAGQLIWLEGNLMPTIDDSRTLPKGQPVQREVHIYALTKTSEAERDESFYKNIQTELIQKVMSDKNGLFKISLPPGKYSLFVKETQGLFANIFDGYGNIMPVEVYKDEVTTVRIEINYMAAY